MTDDLNRYLLKAATYAKAGEISRAMIRAVVVHAQMKHGLKPLPRPSGYIGFRPSYCEVQYAGRDEPSLAVSLFGQPAAYEAIGLKPILVSPQKGYTRARIYDAAQLPLLLAALDLAWELRARRVPRSRKVVPRQD